MLCNIMIFLLDDDNKPKFVNISPTVWYVMNFRFYLLYLLLVSIQNKQICEHIPHYDSLLYLLYLKKKIIIIKKFLTFLTFFT